MFFSSFPPFVFPVLLWIRAAVLDVVHIGIPALAPTSPDHGKDR
jgi:hypothetical protein